MSAAVPIDIIAEESARLARIDALIAAAEDEMWDREIPGKHRAAAKIIFHQLWRARLAIGAGATGLANRILIHAVNEYCAGVAPDALSAREAFPAPAPLSGAKGASDPSSLSAAAPSLVATRPDGRNGDGGRSCWRGIAGTDESIIQEDVSDDQRFVPLPEWQGGRLLFWRGAAVSVSLFVLSAIAATMLVHL